MWLARMVKHLEKGFPGAFAAKPQVGETTSHLQSPFILQVLTATERRNVASFQNTFASHEQLSLEITSLEDDVPTPKSHQDPGRSAFRKEPELFLSVQVTFASQKGKSLDQGRKTERLMKAVGIALG